MSTACVPCDYLSGQGALLIGCVDPGTGAFEGFRPAGDVEELTISVDTEVFEKRENCSGARGIGLRLLQETNVNVSWTFNCIDRENLAFALFGEASVVAGAAVVDEIVSVVDLDKWYGLDHINWDPGAPPVVTGPAGSPTYVLDTDYLENLAAGSIFPLSTGSIPASGDLEVDYTHLGYDNVEAVTRSFAEIVPLRFEGVNTADNNKPLVVDFFRVQTDPLEEIVLINDENAQMAVTASVLVDETITGAGLSKFFKWRQVT
jgi:hypothetical protein